MPKRFLQYLKEEEQQQGYDPLFVFWFFARGRWGAGGNPNNTLGGALGGFATWGEHPRMINMPQFMLDLYDWNGDGIIGDNDQELIFQIAKLAWEIYEETGEFPPIMTPADYRQNWAYYRVLYGKDFPDPNGFAEVPGNFPDSPDTTFPGDDATTLLGLKGLLAWWSSESLAGILDLYQIIYPDVYNEVLRLYDYNGDGTIDFGAGSGTAAGAEYIVWIFMVSYFQEMGYVVTDVPIVPAYEFQEFINNIAMFSDKSLIDYLSNSFKDYFGPEALAALFNIVPDYPTSPPPPPEEIPQNQAPPPQIGGLG